MSHHDHDHDHKHNHDHDHHHGSLEMTFEEKIVKLLEHWIKHNDDHAVTYRGWADQAKLNHMEAVAEIIEEAAEMNLAVNEKFEKAKALISDKG
jgi:hypothetical protein